MDAIRALIEAAIDPSGTLVARATVTYKLPMATPGDARPAS